MGVTKIAITIEHEALTRLDRLVSQSYFPNRSRAIQSCIDDSLARLDANRLAAECAKLDPAHEQAWADLGVGTEEAEWPEY